MEDETIVTRMSEHHYVRGFFLWLAIVGGIAVLVPVAWGLWLVRGYLPIIGYIWLASMAIVPTMLIAWGMIALVRYATHIQHGDIGVAGTWFRSSFGKTTYITPLIAAQAKPEKPQTSAIEIPTVSQLLETNALGTSDLLLGFNQVDGTAVWGSWENLRTFAIAGKGRSGKTVTMFFLILQAVLNGCQVWVADPHARKKSAITTLLRPLSQWVRFAGTDGEIADLVDEFIDTMEARVHGESQDETPQLLVIDEFTRIVADNEKIYHAVIACAQQYAGFGGYAIIAGHEWTGNGKMLAKLRRALHAKFVHRLDEDYAQYLLNSRKIARTTEKLRTGYHYLQDSEGDIHELRTPLGVVQDAATVAERMQLLTAPVDVPQLSPAEITRFNDAETESFIPSLPLLSVKTESEMKDFSTYEGRKAEVQRLRMPPFNFKQGEILLRIWNVKAGATKDYQDAVAEYKSILEELVRSI